MADPSLSRLVEISLLTADWLAAAVRAVGLLPRGLPRPFDAQRVGVVALALCALVFGLQSAIDWTWFVQGPTVMAMAAAGLVAGRAAPRSRPAPRPGARGPRRSAR